ncbi:alpha/beta hydrolase [Pseudaestuariivita atlantica]|uniref:Esterase n=1 Tax=Pseudaestuariivita atlantica TaxID=1317121 RepID=A0A0L1JQ03_9RHOB|nr:alpha/beta hydrolase [Pseudaestuariivita atlantica]KNG93850.1 esterase [Pseudaestuariivita atlantica]
MDQASWDAAYNNVDHIPDGASYPARWQARATTYLAKCLGQGRAQNDLPYGRGDRALFDLILPQGAAEGLVVFVHGGYWLKFDKTYWTHLAAGPTLAGWAVAMPSYDLCPDVRIGDITRQVAQAITVAAEQVAGPIALAGHSAGGHLVSRMMEPGMLPDAVAARLVSCVPISPVSDLAPLMNTSMNESLRIDAGEAQAESPVHMTDRLDVPVTVWVGAAERPSFLDQARWQAEAWGVDLVEATDRHHFDVIDALEDPGSAMCRAILRHG